MSKFDKPGAVATIVYWLREADLPRALNRAAINSLFNGEQPYSEREQADNNINTNVNFLDAPRIAHQARNTLNNAFLKPGQFFKGKLDEAPPEKKPTYERQVIGEINQIMKNSKPYLECQRSTYAQVVLHGLGPCLWENEDDWVPNSVAIGDVLIPSRVRAGLDNLEYFAVLREYTPSKLFRMTHGKQVDKGWNMELVEATLKKYKEDFVGQLNNDDYRSPEKWVEALKADQAFFENESVPLIKIWDFYYLDDESEEIEWKRKMILDYPTESDMAKDFLYNPKRTVAKSLDELLWVMVADGANVAPFQYHSVRGLGWLLYAVCHLQNRLMCRQNDSTFEQYNWYFIVNNPEDRERLNKIDLHHLGIIPEGLSFVKAGDRYQPNPNYVQSTFAMNRQLMAESSAQFRQDVDNGTSKEMTAQEVMARMQSANALVGSMLNLAYVQKKFEYKEILRRFFRKNSRNKDVKKFHEKMKRLKVPAEILDVDRWTIEPEQVMGEGNRALEMAQAQLLLQIYPMLGPEAQEEAKHMIVEAYTNDAKLAERWVPTTKKQITDSVHDAQLAAGTLMMGLPVGIRKGMNHIEYAETMLVSLGTKLQEIEQMGNTTDLNTVSGLKNLANHTMQHIQIIAQDKNQAARVKKYMDAIGQFANLIKGLEQRAMEAQGAGSMDETQAKIQEKMMLAEVNAQIKTQKGQQQLEQKERQFIATQARENAALQNKLQQDLAITGVEAEKIDVLTAAEIRKKNATTNQKPIP